MTPEKRAEQICIGVSFLSKADRTNAIRAISSALHDHDERYRQLWEVVNSWRLLQSKHPGCKPDIDDLARAIYNHKP